MLHRHRGFLISITTVALVGIGLRMIWDASTDRTEPPIWVAIVAALVAVVMATLVANWDQRCQRAKARTHVEGPRPTNPDGSPYRYHQLEAGGWEFCDGCRLWGQGWTVDNPHQCQQTYMQGPFTNREAGR